MLLKSIAIAFLIALVVYGISIFISMLKQSKIYDEHIKEQRRELQYWRDIRKLTGQIETAFPDKSVLEVLGVTSEEILNKESREILLLVQSKTKELFHS